MPVSGKEYDKLVAVIEEKAQLEYENKQLKQQLSQKDEEIVMLKRKCEELSEMAENERYNNMWLRTFIRLSMDKVKHFFATHHNMLYVSFAQSFIMSMMPDEADPKEVMAVKQLTGLPEDDGQGNTYVTGDYMDIHDNNEVNNNGQHD